jgi:hypothetical protein
MPVKPVPIHIKRLCTPWLDQLRPLPEPCPVPQPCPVPEPCNLPHADTRILIDSLFCPQFGLGTPLDSILADMCAWKAIGVKSIVLSVTQDSGDLGYVIGIAKQVGLKVIISTPFINNVSWDEDKWISDIKSIMPQYVKYSPSSWYMSYEINIGWGNGWTGYVRAIPEIRSILDIPLVISPYYWAGPPVPTDDEVRINWGTFVSKIGPQNILSSLQDGVGCRYNMLRRVIGGPAHQDFLNKARIHREICESVGWKSTINVELFDTNEATGLPYPATPDRIKAQIEAEGKPEYVSKGMGLGPCYSGDGVSLRRYDLAWYPNHQQVAEMLIKM